MGEAIPLRYFQSVNEGIKIFLDEDCTIEEKRDEENLITKTYLVTFPNVIRGRKKYTTRYVKNCGTDKLMYVLFTNKEVGGDTTLQLNEEEEKEYGNGILNANAVHKVVISLEVDKETENPQVQLGLASRAVMG